MTYSAGIFATPTTTLREASIAKIDRLCRKLRLRPEHHLVEIGTGWGAFAVHAATRYGCRVTTTTISKEQFAAATARIAAAGVSDRVTVVQQDYRDMTGRYDRLVSVEMIEAVGHENLPAYFAAIERLLAPDGLAAIQAITILDREYDRARRDVDFIRRHVFPGSVIPSTTAMLAAARRTDLRLVHLEEIGPHYVPTLRAWRRNFYRNLDAIRALGAPERFLRTFDYYLCYCEGGFAERYLGDVQLLFTRPDATPPPLLGAI
jgi:cyclopropane-fatty-acyl-phospholipid synthase